MKKKKTFRRTAILAALCLLATLLLPFGGAAEETYPPGTYITNAEMYFRSGPSMDYEIYALIPRNTSVKITETAGAWGRLTFGGVEGWMNLAGYGRSKACCGYFLLDDAGADPLGGPQSGGRGQRDPAHRRPRLRQREISV